MIKQSMGQNAFILQIAKLGYEHLLAVYALVKASLADLNGAEKRLERRLLMAEREVSIFP